MAVGTLLLDGFEGTDGRYVKQERYITLRELRHGSSDTSYGFFRRKDVIEDSIVSYKCGEKFYGEYDGGIRYDDPDMGIDWPYEEIGGKANVINSEKDDRLPSFREFLATYENFLGK